MLTSKRIKRFLRAIELDDDDILGTDKEQVIMSLFKACKKYERFERTSSDTFIEKQLRARINKNMPADDQAEAIDIILNCIYEDSKTTHLAINCYPKVETAYLGEIIDTYEDDEDNKLLAKQALFLLPYNKKLHRKHTKKHKKSILDSGELSEEELYDEDEE